VQGEQEKAEAGHPTEDRVELEEPKEAQSIGIRKTTNGDSVNEPKVRGREP